ncbi:hypothetical protein EDB19DRAFT_1905499 [Suillus lakei]|nr:hypothetical protein EDB19DRAFT_1905499 [Suillus lakei]
MEHRPLDSSPPIPDPSSAPFPSFSMPIPAINVQMPSADAPYGQPYASEHPYASEPPYVSEPPYAPEPPYASEHLHTSEPPYTPEHSYTHEYQHTPEHPYPFQQSQQPYHVPSQVSVSLYHTELQPEPWVPKVPGQSDEEEVDPTSGAICPTTEDVRTGGSVSRRPSRLQRFASFLGLRHKESTASRRS